MNHDYVALIDMELPTGGNGGVIAGLNVKDEQDHIEAMMEFTESLKRNSPFAACVTFVTTHNTEPGSPYVHPAMEQQVARDGSMPGPNGPMWFQLVMSISLVGEEE